MHIKNNSGRFQRCGTVRVGSMFSIILILLAQVTLAQDFPPPPILPILEMIGELQYVGHLKTSPL